MKNQNNQVLNIVLQNLKNNGSSINNEAPADNIFNKVKFEDIKEKIFENERNKKENWKLKKYKNAEIRNILAKNNLVVAVRIRKLNKREIEISATETIKKIDRDTLFLTEPISNDGSFEEDRVKPKLKESLFSFDFIFDKNSKQEEVYLNTSKILLEEVIEGYNATIFAYGATGSGKTYTMIGNGQNPGIMARAVSDLFSLIEDGRNKNFNIKVMYVEVYNENIRDLISGKKDLELREDPRLGMQIVGAVEENVVNAGDVFKLLM